MMREIRYRAWEKATKRMLQVEELAFDGNGELSSVYTTGPDFSNDPIILDGSVPNLENIVLEQYTGFKDSIKRKAIYEGDIVHFKSDGLSGLGFVKWDSATGSWRVDDIRARTHKRGHRVYPFYPGAKYRIYGNIHENPELLEGEK